MNHQTYWDSFSWEHEVAREKREKEERAQKEHEAAHCKHGFKLTEPCTLC